MKPLILLPILALGWRALGALEVDFSSKDSIRKAAALKAHDLMSYYHGNETGQTPGILPGPPPNGPYYWWHAGALWGTMIDYWKYTGDASYNSVVEESLKFQVGPQWDYMEPNVTASLGNDDQAFWGMAAMGAAEANFQNPPRGEPQWLALAQAVFNTQSAPARRDEECNGGLRWQILNLNVGYDYKNSIANGCNFNIAARLARYTRNATYAQAAIDSYSWMESVEYIDSDYNVWDGGHVAHNCTDINHAQWSYNNAILLQGSAFMWDYTKDPIWETRVNGLLENLISVFFPAGVATEIFCERPELPEGAQGACNTDQVAYKGFVHRWMAVTAQLAPFAKERIFSVLRTSAEAAVKQCTGGASGRACGFRWGTGLYDGTDGVGPEMNVLAALMSLLVEDTQPPVHAGNGGTSVGDWDAGGNGEMPKVLRDITRADRAVAGIFTGLVVLGTLVTFWFMTTEVSEVPFGRQPRD